MKRLLWLAMLLCTPAFSQVKISALPAGTTLTGTEQMPAVQSAVTVKTTPADIATYVNTGNSLSTNLSFSDEFLGFTNIAAGVVGPAFVGEWMTNSSGTASTVAQGTATAGHPGILALNTGTTTTGAAWAFKCGASICGAMLLHATNAMTYNSVVMFSAAPTTGDRYTGCIALGASEVPATNYITACAIWDTGSSSARWNLNTTAANVSTNTVAATGPSASTWYNVRIVATTAAVTMFVNGTQVAQNTTNIPTAGLSMLEIINKTTGTTAVTMNVDLVTLTQPVAARIL